MSIITYALTAYGITAVISLLPDVYAGLCEL
ncbi:MAG: hypothetical protein DELT_00364 [Desulfovibrio sp.]